MWAIILKILEENLFVVYLITSQFDTIPFSKIRLAIVFPVSDYAEDESEVLKYSN